MFAFRFVAIGPLLAEIYQIPYLTLKIEGQTFEVLSSIDMFGFRFVAIGPFLAEI